MNNLDTEKVDETAAERDLPITVARVIEQLSELIADACLTDQEGKAHAARQRTEASRGDARQRHQDASTNSAAKLTRRRARAISGPVITSAGATDRASTTR